MIYIFLDTNIYLHYKDYEQLPWSEIVPNLNDFTIVVPPITRREIDKIKDQGKGKISNKARDIAKRFRSVFVEDEARSIPMMVCNAPKSTDYDELSFDKEIQDDQFILSALLFQKQQQCDVLIVAADTNPLITAKAHEIPALYLDDQYRLASELSKEEKELIKTKKELEQYKNRISKPCLTFENGKTFIKVKKPTVSDIEAIVVRAIAEELIATPFIRPDDKPVDNPLVAMTSIVASQLRTFAPKPEEIQRYNNELIEYHKEYEDYVRLKANRDILMKQIYELKFIISNEGTAPTGDLEIFINFPKKINLYDSTSQKSVDLDTPPLKPEQPSFIVSPLFTREMRKKMQYLQTSPMSLTPYGYIDHRPKIWDLDKTVEHEYHFSKGPLLQTLYYDNFFEYGIYIDLMQCDNFAIEYTIVDASLPNPITGALNVVLE